MNLIATWHKAKKYLGGIVTPGHIEIYPDENEVYLGVTNKKTIKLIHDKSDEITYNNLDGGSANTVYNNAFVNVDGGGA